MKVFDCSKEMSAFHDEKVRLKKPQQDEMRGRRDAGEKRLDNGLKRDGFATPQYFPQGSYAMHTMVQDDECDYDIDDGAYFSQGAVQDKAGNPLSPLASRQRVCNALKQDDRLAEPAEVHTNCVRQRYPEGYHIDIPVYRIKTLDNGDERVELASGDRWVQSDARGVTNWFNTEVAAANKKPGKDGQLRRIVCLTKAFGRSRKDWKSKTCSGIVITKLIVDNFVNAENRDDLSLVATWKKIAEQLKNSTAVQHPLGDGDLANEGDATVRFFSAKLNWALGEASALEVDCTRGEARKVWDTIFDTDFFGDQPDSSGNGDNGKKAFVATGKKVDRRDDAGGRFGLCP